MGNCSPYQQGPGVFLPPSLCLQLEWWEYGDWWTSLALSAGWELPAMRLCCPACQRLCRLPADFSELMQFTQWWLLLVYYPQLLGIPILGTTSAQQKDAWSSFMFPQCLDLLDKIALLWVILPLRSSLGSGFLAEALTPVGVHLHCCSWAFPSQAAWHWSPRKSIVKLFREFVGKIQRILPGASKQKRSGMWRNSPEA